VLERRSLSCTALLEIAVAELDSRTVGVWRGDADVSAPKLSTAKSANIDGAIFLILIVGRKEEFEVWVQTPPFSLCAHINAEIRAHHESQIPSIVLQFPLSRLCLQGPISRLPKGLQSTLS
jgi:hypothetical protein